MESGHASGAGPPIGPPDQPGYQAEEALQLAKQENSPATQPGDMPETSMLKMSSTTDGESNTEVRKDSLRLAEASCTVDFLFVWYSVLGLLVRKLGIDVIRDR
jgi:hypothetical protein